MDTEQKEKLKLGFELQRQEKPKVYDTPLREANFCHEICGTNYAEFDEDYITTLKNILRGTIRVFVETVMVDKDSTCYHHGKVYLNENTVDFILEELEHYINTGEWR